LLRHGGYSLQVPDASQLSQWLRIDAAWRDESDEGGEEDPPIHH
jgi:hypothetical protein